MVLILNDFSADWQAHTSSVIVRFVVQALINGENLLGKELIDAGSVVFEIDGPAVALSED